MNGTYTLSVSDNGTGMTKEQIANIFKAFHRLGNAATKDGFGLGLSIVESIVKHKKLTFHPSLDTDCIGQHHRRGVYIGRIRWVRVQASLVQGIEGESGILHQVGGHRAQDGFFQIDGVRQ